MKETASVENAELDDQLVAQEDDSLWTDLARDAYASSQDYFNSSLRKEFEDATAHTVPKKTIKAPIEFLCRYYHRKLDFVPETTKNLLSPV